MIRVNLLLAVFMGLALCPALAATIPTSSTTQEVRVGTVPAVSNLVPPKLLKYTRPPYTDEARKDSIEGLVTVQAAFEADGTFKVLRVIKGLGHGLDENALAAVKAWQFAPAYHNGQRVSVIAQIDIRFSLFDDPQWLRENNRSLDFWERLRPFQRTFERWPMDRRFEQWEAR